MKEGKVDVLNVILEKYSIQILRLLDGKPMRFMEIQEHIKNARTLTLKLTKLQKSGLVEAAPIKVEGKYVNSYKISKRGHEIVKTLKKIV
ncbi:MAG TPA: winged helix-turn-helix transcriptional regulator [Candidatus Aquilonibacter sp.]|nr:winged helix-turn-helix transcriptional regulator [Candidatus Aquilonibacter sp.]